MGHSYIRCCCIIILAGVVFNEMKGVYSQPDNILGRTSQQVNMLLTFTLIVYVFSLGRCFLFSSKMLTTQTIWLTLHINLCRLFFQTMPMVLTVEVILKLYPNSHLKSSRCILCSNCFMLSY